MAANNDIPPVPLPPSAAGVPPVEPAPVTPPAPPAAPVPPAPPATPAAPEPLDALRADPYAAPTAAPAYAQQQAYAPGTYVAAPAQGLAIGGMITGIAAVFLSFFSIGLLPAVAAVILGHLAQRRQPYARPFWITALVTGYIALGISIIWGIGFLLIIITGIATSSY